MIRKKNKIIKKKKRNNYLKKSLCAKPKILQNLKIRKKKEEKIESQNLMLKFIYMFLVEDCKIYV